MNKLIALLLVFALAFSLCACSSSGKTESTSAPAIADAAPPATQESEESAIEMIASEDYSFTKIEPNSDFTKFAVTTTSSELNLAESFSVLAFYMYGGMYNIFNGTEVENIAVDFINEATGQIMNSVNSRDMGE